MDIIELLKTVVIGVIQGITEWLPISSTGHMILADQLIHVKMAAADPAFWEMRDRPITARPRRASSA